eukprot:364877-Chlamydomonas_euryale.AAC.3
MPRSESRVSQARAGAQTRPRLVLRHAGTQAYRHAGTHAQHRLVLRHSQGWHSNTARAGAQTQPGLAFRHAGA